MSRTKRDLPEYRYFRKPRHLNEEAQLRQLLNDSAESDFPTLSKINRIHKRLVALPDAWGDIYPSCVQDKYAIK